MKKNRLIVSACIYTPIIGAIVWQGFGLTRELYSGQLVHHTGMIDIAVNGNVRSPGIYRVAQGTTQFEILRVAGVRPTSDLAALNLMQQVENASELNVGTLEKPVAAKEEPFTSRLEFFFGELSVIGGDGRSVPQHEGLAISPGDRILTEASSQAELSAGAFSRIDMDNFAELTFDKIGSVENDRVLLELFQRAGVCWYKMVYTKNSEFFRINTVPATVSVGGSGADFLVEAQSDRTVISLMDGLLLVERAGGGEAINMISGQSATIYHDERPLQVTKLTPDISANERFTQLSREKINYVSRQMPLNILFCGIPNVFYFITIHYERGVYSVIHLPAHLLIEQFANGISTLDQAFLYGGPVMVATFVERIVDMRIPKYIVFDKDDLIATAGAMGGVSVNVDPHAAAFMKVAEGKRKLAGDELVQFLSPALSGKEDARQRQSDMLRATFDGLRDRSIVPTLLLADQVISVTQTNFGAHELMDHFGRFGEKNDWRYRDLDLPGSYIKKNGRDCFLPRLDECRKFLLSLN